MTYAGRPAPRGCPCSLRHMGTPTYKCQAASTLLYSDLWGPVARPAAASSASRIRRDCAHASRSIGAAIARYPSAECSVNRNECKNYPNILPYPSSRGLPPNCKLWCCPAEVPSALQVTHRYLVATQPVRSSSQRKHVLKEKCAKTSHHSGVERLSISASNVREVPLEFPTRTKLYTGA